jgi:hypothetical protein
MRRGMGKPKAPKKVTYELIRDEPGSLGRHAYGWMRDLIKQYRDDLAEARIALAWCMSWKPDADGRITIGKCRKASDLDRELMEYDFVILLHKGFWLDLKVTDNQRRALLDHELMHAAVKVGENGEPEEDAKGRTVYRIRKHDIEEFADTIRRHGIYRGDLDEFAHALRQAALAGYKPCADCRNDGTPGWREVEIAGVMRMDRCACWVAYQTKLDPATPPAPKPKQNPLPDPAAPPAQPPTH